MKSLAKIGQNVKIELPETVEKLYFVFLFFFQ